MTTPGAPLLGDQEHYRGERVVQHADIDVDEVSEKMASIKWCLATVVAVVMPPLAPLTCFCISPCGARDRLRRKLQGTRVVLTDHAVHYEVDEYESVENCGCQTMGKETKTIPLNNVTDVQCERSITWSLVLRWRTGWSFDRLDIHTPSDPIVGSKDNISRRAEIECPGVRNADDFRNAFYAQRKTMPSYQGGAPIGQVAMGAPAPRVDLAAQLKSLMEMRDAGGLTEEEFQLAKRKLLA